MEVRGTRMMWRSVELRMVLPDCRAAVRGSRYTFRNRHQLDSLTFRPDRSTAVRRGYLQHCVQPLQVNTLAGVQLPGHHASPLQRHLKTESYENGTLHQLCVNGPITHLSWVRDRADAIMSW